MSSQSRVAAAVTELEIETPSWGYGNSGTRFKVFPQPGVPRDPFEKVEDAAIVGRFTGVARSIALHIPWDRVDDFSMLAAFARERGVRIGGINSNTFQDEDYKLGSLCHPSFEVRRKAVDHILECCDIARQTGSTVVKVWLADGSNYPGQDDFRARRRRLIETLREIYPALPENGRMFLEYKFYEPAFYHTDVQDWGQALTVCQHVGERAQVCVDTGHHAMGTNIEQIVSILLQEGRLGGFDLNDKKYGDDDLMVGSIDPYQLFRICHELVKAQADQLTDPVAHANAREVVYMLDQCHNIEPKLPAVIRSVMNLQEAMAKALLVDLDALRQAQSAGDVLEANRLLKDAYDTDVRPLLASARGLAGLPEDPYVAYLASDEERRRAAARVGGVAAGWQ
ncbi:MAG: L-rhamnose isomerase [Chloroflexi bacterium]|nr:L-rhamnose isomerase [Chloroflexota bacterium]MBV9601763.1 L-rhamnose isomerase [Chloroflexota bacterium]